MNKGPDYNLTDADGLTAKQLHKYATDLAAVYAQEKNRRRSLQTAKEKTEAIIASMSDGMLVTDKEHRIIETNPVMYKLLEVEHDDLIGKNFLDLASVSAVKENLLTQTKTIDGHEQENIHLDIQLPGNRLVNVSVSRLQSDKGYVYIFRDITSEKRAENARKELIAILSHELKTPLSAILNFTHLLSEELTDKSFSNLDKYVEHILRNGDRLANTFDELLQFAQLERGEFELFNFKVRIDKILHYVISSLQSEILDKNITINLSLMPENPRISGNEGLLTSLFMHIIRNAVLYSMPNGEVRISLTEKDSQYHIQVDDYGIGIPAAELEKIFSSFYQVQDHVSGGYEGLGIGLAIARHVVEHHHGTIRLESKPGRGTTCFIILPQKTDSQKSI